MVSRIKVTGKSAIILIRKEFSFHVLSVNSFYRRRFKSILLVIILLSEINYFCIGQNCNNIPSSFNSYAEATQLVKSSNFKIKESVNTSKSSWIRGATYYSCDSKKGFLIIRTDDREYIHQNVPIETWNGFKNASSFGSFYNNYIKGNYRVVLKI
jgi:hypothetical protein